jgi:hypothetical protein
MRWHLVSITFACIATVISPVGPVMFSIMDVESQHSLVGGKKKRTCQNATDDDNSSCTIPLVFCSINQPTCSQQGTALGSSCFQVRSGYNLPICKINEGSSQCCDHNGLPIPCYDTVSCICGMYPPFATLQCIYDGQTKPVTNRGRCQPASCE